MTLLAITMADYKLSAVNHHGCIGVLCTTSVLLTIVAAQVCSAQLQYFIKYKHIFLKRSLVKFSAVFEVAAIV